MRTSSPAAAASCARTASASRPGTVRTSRPARARSGTELMLIPPVTVPTLSVGSPRSGWVVGVEREAVEARRSPARACGSRSRRGAASSRARCARRRACRATRRPCARRTASSSSARRPGGRRVAQRAVGARERERAVAAGLLAGAQDDLEAGAAAPERRDALGRHDDRRHAALHVARAAAVQPVAVDLAAERVARPVAAAERDRVEVAGEAQRGGVAVRARPARDEARALRSAELVRDDVEARGLEAGGQDVCRPRLVARRVDRLGADELPGELDDPVAGHYFGSTCVAIAAAPRRARGRRIRAVTCSAPSPVSERTYSSWYAALVRRAAEQRPDEAAEEAERDAEIAGLSSAQRAERRARRRVRAAATPGGSSRSAPPRRPRRSGCPVTVPAVLNRGQKSASTRAGKFALAAMQKARPTSAETLNAAPPAIASTIASAPIAPRRSSRPSSSSRSLSPPRRFDDVDPDVVRDGAGRGDDEPATTARIVASATAEIEGEEDLPPVEPAPPPSDAASVGIARWPALARRLLARLPRIARAPTPTTMTMR